MQAVVIEMPSGMTSRPHELPDTKLELDSPAIKLASSFVRQMRVWPQFEAWVLLIEDGKIISREHVRT